MENNFSGLHPVTCLALVLMLIFMFYVHILRKQQNCLAQQSRQRATDPANKNSFFSTILNSRIEQRIQVLSSHKKNGPRYINKRINEPINLEREIGFQSVYQVNPASNPLVPNPANSNRYFATKLEDQAHLIKSGPAVFQQERPVVVDRRKDNLNQNNVGEAPNKEGLSYLYDTKVCRENNEVRFSNLMPNLNPKAYKNKNELMNSPQVFSGKELSYPHTKGKFALEPEEQKIMKIPSVRKENLMEQMQPEPYKFQENRRISQGLSGGLLRGNENDLNAPVLGPYHDLETLQSVCAPSEFPTRTGSLSNQNNGPIKQRDSSWDYLLDDSACNTEPISIRQLEKIEREFCLNNSEDNVSPKRNYQQKKRKWHELQYVENHENSLLLRRKAFKLDTRELGPPKGHQTGPNSNLQQGSETHQLQIRVPVKLNQNNGSPLKRKAKTIKFSDVDRSNHIGIEDERNLIDKVLGISQQARRENYEGLHKVIIREDIEFKNENRNENFVTSRKKPHDIIIPDPIDEGMRKRVINQNIAINGNKETVELLNNKRIKKYENQMGVVNGEEKYKVKIRELDLNKEKLLQQREEEKVEEIPAGRSKRKGVMGNEDFSATLRRNLEDKVFESVASDMKSTPETFGKKTETSDQSNSRGNKMGPPRLFKTLKTQEELIELIGGNRKQNGDYKTGETPKRIVNRVVNGEESDFFNQEKCLKNSELLRTTGVKKQIVFEDIKMSGMSENPCYRKEIFESGGLQLSDLIEKIRPKQAV